MPGMKSGWTMRDLAARILNVFYPEVGEAVLELAPRPPGRPWSLTASQIVTQALSASEPRPSRRLVSITLSRLADLGILERNGNPRRPRYKRPPEPDMDALLAFVAAREREDAMREITEGIGLADPWGVLPKPLRDAADRDLVRRSPFDGASEIGGGSFRQMPPETQARIAGHVRAIRGIWGAWDRERFRRSVERAIRTKGRSEYEPCPRMLVIRVASNDVADELRGLEHVRRATTSFRKDAGGGRFVVSYEMGAAISRRALARDRQNHRRHVGQDDADS